MSIYRQGPSPQGACPRCRESLLPLTSTARWAAVDALDTLMKGIRTCEKCGGVFADNEASKRIVSVLDRVLLEIGFQASLGRPRRPADGGRSLTCPECLVAMQKIRIEAAACEIDACPAHGTWFDTGELEDVMRAYARARKLGALVSKPPAAREIVQMVIDDAGGTRSGGERER